MRVARASGTCEWCARGSGEKGAGREAYTRSWYQREGKVGTSSMKGGVGGVARKAGAENGTGNARIKRIGGRGEAGLAAGRGRSESCTTSGVWCE